MAASARRGRLPIRRECVSIFFAAIYFYVCMSTLCFVFCAVKCMRGDAAGSCLACCLSRISARMVSLFNHCKLALLAPTYTLQHATRTARAATTSPHRPHSLTSSRDRISTHRPLPPKAHIITHTQHSTHGILVHTSLSFLLLSSLSLSELRIPRAALRHIRRLREEARVAILRLLEAAVIGLALQLRLPWRHHALAVEARPVDLPEEGMVLDVVRVVGEAAEAA